MPPKKKPAKKGGEPAKAAPKRPAKKGGAPAKGAPAKGAPAKAAPKKAAGPKKEKPKSLTKSQLQGLLAEKTDLKKAKAKEFLEALASLVKEELAAGRPIVLPDLVRFVVRRKEAKPAREGRNPFTGEPMTIKAQPAKTVPIARPQRSLKEAVA
jgi:DNA-binding protein HU-beta